LRKHNIADRVRIAEGSFFDSVPGGDAYILKNIMHDWPDEKAVQILRNVRAAAGSRATVLLVELVIPMHNRDFPGKWVDPGDAAELGGARTHRGRVPRPTQPSRIPDDEGGANRFTPQRGGGQSRVTTATGWSGWCLMSGARTPLRVDYRTCQRA
jgi:hypothetical protein